MSRSAAVLCCAVLALALCADTVAAGKGMPFITLGKGKGGCTHECTDVCKDMHYDECKDVSVPYEECKDVTVPFEVCTDVPVSYEECKSAPVTKTKKECSKVCTHSMGHHWGFWGKTFGKGRKLQGKGMGVTVTLGKGKGHSCKDVCKDKSYTEMVKSCETKTKTEKKCEMKTKTEKKCETKTKTETKCEKKTKKECKKSCKPVCHGGKGGAVMISLGGKKGM